MPSPNAPVLCLATPEAAKRSASALDMTVPYVIPSTTQRLRPLSGDQRRAVLDAAHDAVREAGVLEHLLTSGSRPDDPDSCAGAPDVRAVTGSVTLIAPSVGGARAMEIAIIACREQALRAMTSTIRSSGILDVSASAPGASAGVSQRRVSWQFVRTVLGETDMRTVRTRLREPSDRLSPWHLTVPRVRDAGVQDDTPVSAWSTADIDLAVSDLLNRRHLPMTRAAQQLRTTATRGHGQRLSAAESEIAAQALLACVLTAHYCQYVTSAGLVDVGELERALDGARAAVDRSPGAATHDRDTLMLGKRAGRNHR